MRERYSHSNRDFIWEFDLNIEILYDQFKLVSLRVGLVMYHIGSRGTRRGDHCWGFASASRERLYEPRVHPLDQADKILFGHVVVSPSYRGDAVNRLGVGPRDRLRLFGGADVWVASPRLAPRKSSLEVETIASEKLRNQTEMELN